MDAALWQELYTTSEKYIYKHIRPRPENKNGLKQSPWWTDELEVLRGLSYRADREAYRWRGTPDHPAHGMYKSLRREYARAVRIAKLMHEVNEANKERRMIGRELPDPSSML